MLMPRWTTTFAALIPLALAITGVASAAPLAFSKQPSEKPYLVTEGERDRLLECAITSNFSNRELFQPSWTRVASDVPNLLSLGGKTFSREYEVVDDGEQYSLRIHQVTFDRDNAKFFCAVLDMDSGLTHQARPANVVVLVEPQLPIVSVQPTAAVREGDVIRVECESRLGNPPPKFTWHFNNGTRVPDNWHTVHNASKHGQPTVSILEWRAVPVDNGAYLTCEIWNEALAVGSHKDTDTKRLIVQYAPRVSAGPVAEYNAEEGETIELVCEADANPPPTSFEWQHMTSGQRWTNSKRRFTVTRADAGQLRCAATNAIGTSFDTVTLNVLYAPVLKVTPLMNPAEGEDVMLVCEVDANPKTDSITWTGVDGVSHKGHRLHIHAITRFHYHQRIITCYRSQSGNYTCSATNLLTLYSAKSGSVQRNAHAVTIIDVKRAPGRAVINPSLRIVYVGDSVTLSCATVDDDGSPPAQFRWATPDADYATAGIPPNPTLLITKAQLTDIGQYRCTPFNEIGPGPEATYQFQVVEAATIARPLTREQLLSADDAVVPVLECEARGHPAPVITWMKDGQPLVEKARMWSIETTPTTSNTCGVHDRCAVTVLGSLKWNRSVQWSDKGRYSCLARNGPRNAARSETVVRVVHAPVMLSERFPSDALAAADLGTTARIICRVSARPEPTFRWFRDSTEIIDGSERYSFRSSPISDVDIDEYESVLEVAQVTTADYGEYMCRAINGRGVPAQVIVQLLAKSKPQTPTGVRLIRASSNSLLVAWRAGFDGGDQQQFSLEYRRLHPITGRSDAATASTITITAENATYLYLTADEMDGDNAAVLQRRSEAPIKHVVFNMSGLVPLSSYVIRIRANSALGQSDWTPITSASTIDVELDTSLPQPQAAVFYADNRRLDFEAPRTAQDLCILLYVGQASDSSSTSFGDPWRALDACTKPATAGNVAELVEADSSAERLRARFCRRSAELVCSQASDVLVASSVLAVPWPIVLPIGAVLVLLAALCGLVYICCRMRKAPSVKSKSRKFDLVDRRPKVSAPLPQSETKNTIVHGSAADSGVFTLASQPPSAQTHQSFNPNATFDAPHDIFSSFDGMDRWGQVADGYDFNNDPYLQEYAIGGPVGGSVGPGSTSSYLGDGFAAAGHFDVSHGLVDLHPASSSPYDEQHDGDTFTSSSRRVMREIIV